MAHIAADLASSARLCRNARRQARFAAQSFDLRLPRSTQTTPVLRRPSTACNSSASPDSGGSADIDALAKMLSQQAAQLRASMSDEEVAELVEVEAREQVVFQNVAPRMGPQLTAEMEQRVIDEVGEGGFMSDDFEIVSRLGRISVSEATTPGVPSTPRTAVIAYVARYIARMAYSLPVPTLIKEYLPIAKSVAYNELLLLQHLCGIPEDKYMAAVNRPSVRDPPIVPLLGYFTSAPSEDAEAELSPSGGTPTGTPLDEDSVWLVYKWEGLRPLNLYLDGGAPPIKAGIFKTKEMVAAEAWGRRKGMLRALARGLLSAIDFIHSADVVHGALSSGSVLLNTSTDLPDPDDDLVVKIDGFGFGKWFSASSLSRGLQLQGRSTHPELQGTEYGPVTLDAGLEEGKKADLQAAALLLAEAFSCCLADDPAGHMTSTTARRLLFDFQENSMAFREYCLQDPDQHFTRLVSFLDERQGAGWDFVDQLMAGAKTGLELSQHPFLRPGK